jgi:hypothetical protein
MEMRLKVSRGKQKLCLNYLHIFALVQMYCPLDRGICRDLRVFPESLGFPFCTQLDYVSHYPVQSAAISLFLSMERNDVYYL